MAFQPQQIPSYGYCESYFVQNHDDDDGVYARAAADQERARAHAKARQREFAAELSQLTADEYEDDILDHMERMEDETMPDLNSIEVQTEIQWFMRPYLLDFLLEAHFAFQLLPETLFLAVNLLDRYCSKRVVYKRHYQLVGCSALLIAAKYGDRKERVPTIRELKSMCCSLYDDDMFTQMEWHVLQTLNWIVGHPTVSSFLQLATFDRPDAEVENMALYISEMAMYHKDFIPVRPSVMARSSLALARCILNRPQSDSADWASRYDANVVMDLSNFLAQPSQALFRKYSTPQLSAASTTVEAFLQHQAMIARQNVQYTLPTSHPEEQQMVPSQDFLTPQTPQKPGYPMVPVGVLTPPITPDKGIPEAYGQGQNLLPRLQTCVPTPPPSVQHQQYAYQSYVQTQYMQ